MNLSDFLAQLDRRASERRLLPAEVTRLLAFAEALERPSLPTVLDDLLQRIDALTAMRGPILPTPVQSLMFSAFSAGVCAKFGADVPLIWGAP